jgi:hypothetical protein
MSTASETAREYGSTITETIQRNPMPAALIGAGLGWLWWNVRQQSSSESIHPGRATYDYSSRYETPYSYETQPAGASTLRDTAEKAKDRVEHVAGQVQQKASDMGASVRHQAERATDSFGRWMHENPLAVGAMALALGAAVGMAIPETRQEQQLMGDARDRLTEQARQTAQEVKQKVQAVAQEAMDTAKEEARSQGLTG